MPKMIRVGMVGLGKMGSSMALNIAKAGFPLSMYDAEEGRTHELRENWVKDKHLPPGPGGLCTPNLHPRESPADVMLSSDVCLVCVHSEQQTIDAVAGDEGLLTVGSSAMTDKVIVDHGTISPRFAKTMAETVAKTGGAFLDAPISGGPQGAKDGTLSIMVGGQSKHLDTCMAVFEAMGSRIEHMGPAGAGAAAKLVNQHLVVINTVAACEAYVLAKSLGLRDTAKLRDVLGASWGQSQMLDHVLGDLLRVEEAGGDVEVLRRSLAPIKTIAKDAAIVTRAAEQSGVPAELFASARSWIEETTKGGYSDCSFAAVAAVLEERADDAENEGQ